MTDDAATPTVEPPAVRPKRKRRPQNNRKRKRQPPYHVILWNDEDHSYEYVILMMRRLFGHPIEMGMKIALEVDTRGRAIVMTTTRELAELKRDQIHAFGRDDLIEGCLGSMWATIEPAPGD
ncbi:MAG: ATP-dependent Clp protease adaptor ClpS [Pirellulales bacterium]